MQKFLVCLLLLGVMFGASYPTIPHEFESRKIIPADWLNDNNDALLNAITDGTAKINVNEIEINGLPFIGNDRRLNISTLTLTGDMTIEGNQTIEGTLTVSGNSTISVNGTVRASIIEAPTVNVDFINVDSISASDIDSGYVYADEIDTPVLNVNTVNVGYVSANVANVGYVNIATINCTFASLNSAIIDKVQIITNNINATTGDLILTVPSGNRVKLGATFGQWVTNNYVKDTVYVATKDLFVCASVGGGLTNNDIVGLTDSSNPPITEVARGGVNITNAGIGSGTVLSIFFPVKKGDFWKITSSYTPTIRTLDFGI